MEKLVIVGGGAGGVILANSLDPKKFDITLIDKSPVNIFQPAYLYVAFKGAKPNIARKTESLVKRGIKVVEAKATSIDLQSKQVTTDKGQFAYDKLVVATGTVTDPGQIEGLAEVNNTYGDYHTSIENAQKLWKSLSSFSGGTIALGMASPVCKCPPSPLEGMLLVEEYINKKGLKDKTKLIFFTPYPRAYPAEPMNEVIEPIMKSRNIEIMTFFDVENIDTKNRKINSIEGDSISYDLPIIIPPCVGVKIDFKPNVLDGDGFIKADKETMLIEGFKDAFAIGDATNIPTAKSGVTAHLQAKVVAKILNGEQAKFDGRTNCPFDVGYGKATFVIGDYSNPVVKYPPSRLNHFMKMMMERIYWSSLKGTWDWMFDMYFKHSNPKKLGLKYNKAKGGAQADSKQ
ncbi:MAG: NAD(P)/FAD-dependent oxidoreductase [Candidatus Micrarchaeia archaeon]